MFVNSWVTIVLKIPKSLICSITLYTKECSAYQNFFCPSVKLVEKKRIGSKYKKRYDDPQTPYQRLLKAKVLSEEKTLQLAQIFTELNPFDLKKSIERKLKIIFHTNQVKSI